MPKKDRTINRKWQDRIHGTDTDGSSVDTTYDVAFNTLDESIMYDCSRLGVGYTPCTHVKRRWHNVEANVLSRQIGVTELSDITTSHPLFHFVRHGTDMGYGRCVGDDIVDRVDIAGSSSYLNFLGTKGLWPKIPKIVSILNFLYELRDLERMFFTWNGKQKFLTNISSHFLNVEFNWLPFVQDIIKILKALANFKKKLRKYISGFHFPHVRHYTRDLHKDVYGNKSWQIPRYKDRNDEETAVPGNAHYEPYTDASGHEVVQVPMRYFRIMRSIVPGPVKHVTTMKFTYFAPELLGTYGELKAWLDAFDVTWDPQIIWDAIPFSFLVDWFYDVGAWLSAQFRKPAYKVYVRIIDFCISTKVTVTTSGILRIPQGGSGPPYVDIPYADTVTKYHRIITPPVLIDPTGVSNPLQDLEKVLLALALGHNCSRPNNQGPVHKGVH